MHRIPQASWNRLFSNLYRRVAPNRQLSVRSSSQGSELSSHTPELCKEGSGGTYDKITEGGIYRYTKHRWLYNEQSELSKRHVKFNLTQLIDVAIKCCDGARYCTRVLKCSEGLRNKAFILTMDNGAEVFAKIPNPNAGPSQYTTASEVATLELLRDVLNIPAPRILAWSSVSANSPVGAEHIITEKAPGVRLGSVWDQWSRESKLKLVTQVIDIENKLMAIQFPKHGSIYFKDDLRSLTGKVEHIKVDPVVPALSRFSIGPLTSAELWSNGRSEMNLDRGPWLEPCDYTQALGHNEIAWIESHARPRMNYHRSLQDYELPRDGLDLLSQYMNVARYLVPPSTDKMATSIVLWHPDLHLDNVFVDPDTRNITCIVDWQSACVAPLFYQSTVPRMFRHHRPVQEGWVIPEKPENYNALSENEKKKVDNDFESEILHKYYEAQVAKRSPRHWAVLLHQATVSMLRNPVWLVSGVWENQDLFFLRQSLISLSQNWQTIPASGQLPCPIYCTDKELQLHLKEEENMDGVGQMLTLFRDQAVLPVDGMVDPEDYAIARDNCRKFKEIFVGLAQNDAERDLYEKLWPYQESENPMLARADE